MKKLGILMMALIACMMLSSTAMADSPTLQEILNNITVGPIAGKSSVNVETDRMANDSYWSITGSGGSLSTMIIEVAGLAAQNGFGVYDMSNSNKKVELFSGAATTGSQVTLGITTIGQVYVKGEYSGVDFAANRFGFYITTGNNETFYSDNLLNNGEDHMLAFQGKNVDTIQIGQWAPGLWTNNEYALAFEDLSTGSDWDYNDMVVMVESVTNVPEPTTLTLLGAGLIGLAFARRKRDDA